MVEIKIKQPKVEFDTPIREVQPKRITSPMVLTSVRVSPEFHKLAQIHKIGFTEAMRVGISVLLAERGVTEYDNKLNITRKIERMSKLLAEKCEEIEKIKKSNK